MLREMSKATSLYTSAHIRNDNQSVVAAIWCCLTFAFV